jgi:phenylalanyl-tRNA synthetase alpha subunit
MARRKNTKRIDPRYFLHETTDRDIVEQISAAIKEAELAPAMYNALKAQGKLPPGSTIKGQTAQAKGAGTSEKHFDDQTGAPLTAKGKELCAKNPECKKKHLTKSSGAGRRNPITGAEGPNRQQMSQVMSKNYVQLKRSLNNMDATAMMADEVKEAFANFEALFLTFVKQYKAGR